MGKLDGRVAIVTGASRGIGEEVAVRFAAEGARVVCVARTMNEGDHRVLEGSLAGTVARIREVGGEACAVAANVADELDCERVVATALDTHGRIDVLVNDAALTYYAPVVDFDIRRWITAFAVNVHGPFMLAKMVLPGMMARRSGAIVNISSGSAIGPGRTPFNPAVRKGGTMYGATKAALERFTQGVAHEVDGYGITVAAVSPSQVVPTPGTVYHKLMKSLDDPRGEPPDYLARAVLLLATEPSDRVNGRVTYSQQILAEYGLLERPTGRGVTTRGSGYSEI